MKVVSDSIALRVFLALGTHTCRECLLNITGQEGSLEAREEGYLCSSQSSGDVDKYMVCNPVWAG